MKTPSGKNQMLNVVRAAKRTSLHGIYRNYLLKIVVLVSMLIGVLSMNSADAAIRIMPLGDSITFGVEVSGAPRDNDYVTGYRRLLYTDLTGLGYDVDFVGSVQTGSLAVPDFDDDHEGHPGICAQAVADRVYSWLEQNPADIVLLHIGTNCLTTRTQQAEKILDNIFLYNQDITVFLALIIDRVPHSEITSKYNSNLLAMASKRIAQGDNIVVVNMERALTYPGDMADWLHPNDTGYEKMSDVWKNALLHFFETTKVFPTISSSPVTSAMVDTAYRYEVTAGGYPSPSYALPSGPVGMTIDEATGVIDWTPTAAGVYAVTVEAANAAGTDIQRFTITVTAPELSASPTSLDMGMQSTSSATSRTLTLSTAGPADLTVTDVVITGDSGDFSCDGATSFTVSPGSAVALNIRFHPVADGDRSAVLTIVHDGDNSPLAVTLTGTASTPKTEERMYAVNCGGSAVIGAEGVWEADRYYFGSTNTYKTARPIGGTVDDALYQTERYGKNFSYSLPVAPGEYIVKLHFAEIYFTTPGSRVFNVDVENGQGRLVDFDIVAEAGPNVAATKSFSGIWVTDGTLDIRFAKTIDKAKISAVEVFSVHSHAL